MMAMSQERGAAQRLEKVAVGNCICNGDIFFAIFSSQNGCVLVIKLIKGVLCSSVSVIIITDFVRLLGCYYSQKIEQRYHTA